MVNAIVGQRGSFDSFSINQGEALDFEFWRISCV